MLGEIYNALMADDFIASEAGGRIKYYEFPATGDITAPYIVIDPLMPGFTSDFGDNRSIAEEHMYQIDVMTSSRTLTEDIARQVRRVLEDIGIMENNSGLDEWDQETGIFRIARRYTGKQPTIE